MAAVVERGRSLQSSAITESLETLQDDYTDLCTTATVRRYTHTNITQKIHLAHYTLNIYILIEHK